MAVSSKFAAFNITDITYNALDNDSKTLKWLPIPASVLLPKSAKPGKHPVMVRWHGGCFITGHRMYPEWFGNWILELAVRNDAIIVSPDYRLMPEASGETLLCDVSGLFSWLLNPAGLASVLPDGISADLDHILVTGESAGGWLAMQSPWSYSSKDKVCAVILHYPMRKYHLYCSPIPFQNAEADSEVLHCQVDMRDPYYQDDYEKQLFTPKVPQLDRAMLQDYIRKMKHANVVTSATPPDRVPLVVSTLQQGAYRQFFGSDNSVYPLEILKWVKQAPAVWLIHGTGDTVIPVEGSYKFERIWKERFPNERLLVHYDEGSDHGFDNAPGVNLETDWVKEGLDFMSRYWPQCQPLIKGEEFKREDNIDHIKIEETVETTNSSKKRRRNESV